MDNTWTSAWLYKVNKTATFKEVFETVETGSSAAYEDFPENTFAEKIIKLRMLHGLNKRQFATRCEIGYSSVCKYEIGYTPSSYNLGKVRSALNLDINYFN